MDQPPTPPRSDQPWPSPDAAFLNLGRSGLGCSLVVLGLLLFFTASAAAGALWPERVLTNDGAGAERTIAAVIAIGLGVLTVVVLLMLVPTLRTHGLAVDRWGVWFVTTKRAEGVAWSQIRAIGGSWRERKRTPKASVGAKLGHEIVRAATTDDGRELFAVEVFLHDPGSVAGRTPFDSHQRLTRDEDPPVPGLPNSRLRFVIRDMGDYREMAGLLYQWVPQLWIGEYRRDSAVF
ncbi:hypothetical protein [Halostreptopolyspora alba]|uniref:Uncharacterized protein n=1 Tax=Halostreptopolyspora alba TaxID=2487137 RepID=A0A3N0EF31_9ACTN|nr:hypothetical protein EFW17_04560 [Nocardiopsaceae bacterium YIM 96095]